MSDSVEKVSNPKLLKGVVVSNKADKTISVLVERKVAHKTYGKMIKRSVKISAHDMNNECNMGDYVEIIECAPLSKKKSFTLSKIIKTN